MSFINGLLDFTVSISYQPSCTVTHKGSRSPVYEINAWLWNFGRFQPRSSGWPFWPEFRSPRPKGFAESPGLKRSSALGRPEMPGSGQLKRTSPAEDIWHAYTWHIPIIYDCSVNHAFQGIVWCPSHRNAYVHIGSDPPWQFRYYFCRKNAMDHDWKT